MCFVLIIPGLRGKINRKQNAKALENNEKISFVKFCVATVESDKRAATSLCIRQKMGK